MYVFLHPGGPEKLEHGFHPLYTGLLFFSLVLYKPFLRSLIK